jgi:hypothetical protein
MPTTVHIPLALSAVNMADANCFWTAKDGTNFDYGCLAFKDAALGKALFWGIVPKNLAATPAWNLILHHKAASGTGGNVVLTVKAKDVPTATALDAALTALHSSTAFAVETSANLTITTLSGTNYDSAEAIAAGNLLLVEVSREAADVNDTVNAEWNLLALVVRVDV